jgi:hypothetical protein
VLARLAAPMLHSTVFYNRAIIIDGSSLPRTNVIKKKSRPPFRRFRKDEIDTSK